MVKLKTRNKIMRLVCDYFSDESHQQMDSVMIRSKLKFSQQETVHSLRVLEAMGYITFEEKTPPHGFIRITPLGKSYFEAKQDKRIEFVRKSIITPILVSIATTLLLNWLPYWLPQILEWVQSHLGF